MHSVLLSGEKYKSWTVLVAVVDEEKEESSKDISVSNAVVLVSVVVKDKMSFGGG